MTRNVLVSLSGLQFVEKEAPEPVEVMTAGEYFRKNEKHYLFYEEYMEGFEAATKNTIKISPDCMELTKKGVANVHMVFEKNKKNVTYYYTPYGSLLIGIEAKKISVKEEEEEIDVKVEYTLEVNYEHLADCHIHLNIKSKHAGECSVSSMTEDQK
jgi:uncharacterized beta-barrel protein YwiB (DUF1934 family)